MNGDIPDLSEFFTAISNQHWPLVVGAGLVVLVWALRSFVIPKIEKNVLPWFTLGLAIVATAATRMTQHINAGGVWWQGMVVGILEGMGIGFAAIGYWDTKQTIFKRED
jgi:type II secretory pathway component PulF